MFLFRLRDTCDLLVKVNWFYRIALSASIQSRHQVFGAVQASHKNSYHLIAILQLIQLDQLID